MFLDACRIPQQDRPKWGVSVRLSAGKLQNLADLEHVLRRETVQRPEHLYRRSWIGLRAVARAMLHRLSPGPTVHAG